MNLTNEWLSRFFSRPFCLQLRALLLCRKNSYFRYFYVNLEAIFGK